MIYPYITGVLLRKKEVVLYLVAVSEEIRNARAELLLEEFETWYTEKKGKILSINEKEKIHKDVVSRLISKKGYGYGL